MTKPLAVLSVIALVVLAVCASAAQAQEPPDVTITLLNPPEEEPLELAVGESYTFDILVTSSDPFLLSMVMPDLFYPGRGIFVRGGDRAGRGTEATLHLTITGKASTAGLAAVSGWPQLDQEWGPGVAPVSLAVGVRFQGGVVLGERINFSVLVP